MRTQTHIIIIHNYSLKRRTQSKYTKRLVILLLLTHKQNADLSIIYHVLYLCFRTCRIKWYCYNANSICSVIRIKMLNTILSKNCNTFLWLNSKIKQSITNLLHLLSKIIPGNSFPLFVTEVLISDCCT